MTDPVAEEIPPHHRQDRLGAAGRPRRPGLKRDWLASLADDIAALAAGGAEILVVSSGAIALGRTILGLGKRALKLEESQAAAAVGQIALAGAWSEELGRTGLTSGPDPADARRHRGAPPLPQRPRHHLARCSR